MIHIWPYMYALSEGLEDVMPAILAAQELDLCPPFRKCKSRKWQRRRNKHFYHVLDGLKSNGGDAT